MVKRSNSLSYRMGAQWGRMSWSSRLGAVAASGALLFVVYGMAKFYGAQEPKEQALAPIVPAAPTKVQPPTPTKADIEINRVLAGARLLRESMKKPESF